MPRFEEVLPSGDVAIVRCAPFLIEQGYVTPPDRPDLSALRDDVEKRRKAHGKTKGAQKRLQRAVHDRLRLELRGQG